VVLAATLVAGPAQAQLRDGADPTYDSMVVHDLASAPFRRHVRLAYAEHIALEEPDAPALSPEVLARAQRSVFRGTWLVTAGSVVTTAAPLLALLSSAADSPGPKVLAGLTLVGGVGMLIGGARTLRAAPPAGFENRRGRTAWGVVTGLLLGTALLVVPTMFVVDGFIEGASS
jgi:hypothetical protein